MFMITLCCWEATIHILYRLSVLSVRLWYTDSDYPFGIFKLFLYIAVVITDLNRLFQKTKPPICFYNLSSKSDSPQSFSSYFIYLKLYSYYMWNSHSMPRSSNSSKRIFHYVVAALKYTLSLWCCLVEEVIMIKWVI